LNIARLLQSLDAFAVLLEIDGANSFKVSAYQRALRALAEFSGDLPAMIEAKTLTSIDGVGKGIADTVTEFARSGSIAELEALRAKYPPGLLELTEIQGFGPKKARAVHADLGIGSLAELKAACEDGRIAKLKGFGAKTAANILQGIAQREKFSGRRRLDVALSAAEPVLAFLRQHPAVLRAEMGGSIRRRRETVGDIDFVAATNDPAAVMQAFCSMPSVQSVLGRGETKSSVLLDIGMQADLRCVADHQFPFALMHFTGSKEHNTRMRTRAKERGLKLNEYGLFPESDGDSSLPAKDEADIFRALELTMIPPEMREDTIEFERAGNGSAIPLLRVEDLRGLLHLHTHFSDGKPTVRAYAEWAAQRGFQWMALSDHSQSLTVANGLSEERVLQQKREIAGVNAEFAGRVRLFAGIESDILVDGSLDYSDDFLPQFEWIVASVHSHFNLTEAEQTARICRAIANPHTTVLGHLTGRLILSREGYPLDQKAVIREAAAARVAIEINANPMRLDLDWRLIHYAIEQGCMLCISPDAHALAGLDDFHFGIHMARKGFAEPRHLLNCLSAKEFVAFAYARK
jgi:DNA polymerase (family 10)